MKLSGSISISRCYSANGSSIHISIVDEMSGCEIVDGSMSIEDFGAAITGSSNQPFNFELRPTNAGKKHEHKHVLLDRPRGYGKKAEQEAVKIVAPFEIDGWKARVSDVTNHHNWAGDKVKVSFDRFV